MHEQPNVPYGYCQCGCGQKTRISRITRTERGIVAGEPTRYVHGHTRHALPRVTEAPQCACGCGTTLPISRKASQQTRYVKGHHRRGLTLTYVETDAGYETPCWVWQGALCQGYGQINAPASGFRGPAHIYFYVQRNGPVPDGYEVHHECENRACVNPTHLRPVTDAEHRRLRRDTKLDAAKAAAIRRMARHGMAQRSIASRFGVTQSTVWAVVNGRIWNG